MVDNSIFAFIAEQRITEAAQAGAFDNLPGSGKPLHLEDLSNVPPELRMAYKILKNSGYLPPEIAQRKELGSLCDFLDSCPDEKERLKAMKRLRLLMERMNTGATRHMQLEQNDEYLNKILERLERHEGRH